MAKRPISAEEALKRAAAYCSKAERSEQDVRERLFHWGLDNREDAEHVIDWLKEESFIDEVRFTRAFVHDKFAYERWGRLKIARGLAAKHISPTLARDVLEELIDPDAYRAALRHLLEAKAKGMPRPLRLEDRARIYRFATQRGYELDLVKEELGQMAD